MKATAVGQKRTGSSADIVEGKLSYSGVELEEEGERLANATGSTEDGDLGKLERRASTSVSARYVVRQLQIRSCLCWGSFFGVLRCEPKPRRHGAGSLRP